MNVDTPDPLICVLFTTAIVTALIAVFAWVCSEEEAP